MSYVIAVANQKGLAVNGQTITSANAVPLRPLRTVRSVSTRTPNFEGIISS